VFRFSSKPHHRETEKHVKNEVPEWIYQRVLINARQKRVVAKESNNEHQTVPTYRRRNSFELRSDQTHNWKEKLCLRESGGIYVAVAQQRGE